MKFASSYEPNQYEADIYGAWEAAGVFDPKITTKPVDDDGDGIDDREELDGGAEAIAESEGVRSLARRGVAREPRGDGRERRAPRLNENFVPFMEFAAIHDALRFIAMLF